tara:strand:+ start:1053 stop:1319 length:267 start_codon:yes stop_codon:yes gene_type:complete
MEIKENIIKKLSLALSPLFIEVEDQSHLHAGHNEAAKNGGTHFKISIKSSKFNNIKPIERHRIAMNILKEEFNNGLHAVSFDLKGLKD